MSHCVNPYCLEDREDADCPDCGGKKFPPFSELPEDAKFLLKKIRGEDYFHG